MKHMFASCAVIALMTAPAVAQSTFEPTEPLVESEQTLDPTMRDDSEMPAPIEQDAVPAAEAEPAETADVELDEDAVATTTTEVDEQEIVADADRPSDDMTAAGTETVFQNEAMLQAETFEPPIVEASLPDDYSTADLNAIMLAQLQVVSVEIADAAAASGMNGYASAESFNDTQTDMEMTADGEATPKAYASTEMVDRSNESDASDTAGTEMMAGEADESQQMADQSYGTTVTVEGDIDQTAVEIAARDERFTTLVELVGIAGLEEDLARDGPYTVFAPTNEAFAALPQGTLDHLKSEAGQPELVEILKAHVAEGAVLARDVPVAGQALETIGDASLNVTGSYDGTLTVQGSNTIGEGISASNGVIYAVDAVILPEATPAPAGN